MNLFKSFFYFFSIFLITTSCKKDDTQNPPASIVETGVNSNYYVSFKYNESTNIFMRENFDNYKNTISKEQSGDCGTIGSGYILETQISNFNIPLQNTNLVSIQIKGCIRPSEQNAIFIGRHAFADTTTNSGIIIEYLDNEGVKWTTYTANNTLSGLRFDIATITLNSEKTESKYIAIGAFSCDVKNNYNDIKIIRDGKFKMRIGTP